MKEGLSGTVVNHRHLYFDGIDYELNKCVLDISNKDYLIYSASIYAIGIWIPMLLILVVYILIYVKLKKQAQFRQRKASINSGAQMVQLSQTFTIVVLVFFICYLPLTILTTIDKYNLYIGKNRESKVRYTAKTIFTVLFFSNSCMNPIIYSKIHVKIYNHVKQLVLTYRDRCPCNSFEGSLQRPASTIPAAPSRANIVNKRVMHPSRYDDYESAHVGPYHEKPNSSVVEPCKIGLGDKINGSFE